MAAAAAARADLARRYLFWCGGDSAAGGAARPPSRGAEGQGGRGRGSRAVVRGGEATLGPAAARRVVLPGLAQEVRGGPRP